MCSQVPTVPSLTLQTPTDYLFWTKSAIHRFRSVIAAGRIWDEEILCGCLHTFNLLQQNELFELEHY